MVTILSNRQLKSSQNRWACEVWSGSRLSGGTSTNFVRDFSRFDFAKSVRDYSRDDLTNSVWIYSRLNLCILFEVRPHRNTALPPDKQERQW